MSRHHVCRVCILAQITCIQRATRKLCIQQVDSFMLLSIYLLYSFGSLSAMFKQSNFQHTYLTWATWLPIYLLRTTHVGIVPMKGLVKKLTFKLNHLLVTNIPLNTTWGHSKPSHIVRVTLRFEDCFAKVNNLQNQIKRSLKRNHIS